MKLNTFPALCSFGDAYAPNGGDDIFRQTDMALHSTVSHQLNPFLLPNPPS